LQAFKSWNHRSFSWYRRSCCSGYSRSNRPTKYACYSSCDRVQAKTTRNSTLDWIDDSRRSWYSLGWHEWFSGRVSIHAWCGAVSSMGMALCFSRRHSYCSNNCKPVCSPVGTCRESTIEWMIGFSIPFALWAC